MPDEENVYDASAAPSSFELKFIECTHVITVPLRVHPDPHAPKPRPAAPARYDSRDFFSRPVPVPGRCPACHKASTVTKPCAKAAAAGAAAVGPSAPAATGSVARAVEEPEPTPPP
jgi:hypothetical protein